MKCATAFASSVPSPKPSAKVSSFKSFAGIGTAEAIFSRTFVRAKL